MRKLISLCCAGVLLFTACQKNSGTQPTSAAITTATHSASRDYSGSTPGEVHNLILQQYDSIYGLGNIPSPVTISVAKTIDQNCLRIAVAIGLLDNSIYSTSLSDFSSANLMSSGYFTNDSLLRNTQDVFSATSSCMHNSHIEKVIGDINSSSMSGNDFLSYADARIASLTNLNDTERVYIDGYKSVLHSSRGFWSNHTHTANRSIEDIAKADSYGYVKGFWAAVDAGYWYLSGPYAQYYSALCSAAAAR